MLHVKRFVFGLVAIAVAAAITIVLCQIPGWFHALVLGSGLAVGFVYGIGALVVIELRDRNKPRESRRYAMVPVDQHITNGHRERERAEQMRLDTVAIDKMVHEDGLHVDWDRYNALKAELAAMEHAQRSVLK